MAYLWYLDTLNAAQQLRGAPRAQCRILDMNRGWLCRPNSATRIPDGRYDG